MSPPVLRKLQFVLVLWFLHSPQLDFAFLLSSPKFPTKKATTSSPIVGSPALPFTGHNGPRITMQGPRISRKSSAPTFDGLRRLPRVFPGSEIMARALKRASFVKEDTAIGNPRSRCRKLAAESINALSKELTKPLGEILDGYKIALARLQPFEKVVADLTVRSRELAGFGSLPETLTAVKELRKTTSLKAKSYVAVAANAETRKLAEDTMHDAFDEIQNLWTRDAWILEQLMDIGRELKSVPMLDCELPTVVLVGSPNVGKSSIVRAISTGTPEVNNYPFTTRGMTLGHILDPKTGEKLCQVMDTPGLLDRPDDARNEMELLTLASMQHIPSLVLFVMDATGGSGDKSPLEAQLAIRKELVTRFKEHEWIDVLSKADLPLPADCPAHALPADALRLSVATGDGVKDLRRRILNSLTVRENRTAREAWEHARQAAAARAAFEE